MSGKRPKIRVAVLGGGVGAMTAAFELTSTPELRERYEVTVHQLGWRLGGKGASGRDASRADSIEEHGLHMWMGFYHNAFRAYRELFLAWKRPSDHPWKTWDDAFTRQDFITFMERTSAGWGPWTVKFPRVPGMPGDPGTTPTVGELVVLAIGWLKEIFHGMPQSDADDAHAGLDEAHALAAAAPADIAEHTDAHRAGLLGKLEGFVDWVRAEADGAEEAVANDWRRLRELMEIGWAVVHGLYEDEIHDYADFDKIDHLELKAWLAKYGAGPVALDGGLLRSFYDLAFCFEGGDTDKPSVAAGCALRTLLRMGLGYKGSVLWKMNAGMGDVVFTPFYEALKDRGVKFEFFHAVRAVELTADRAMIGRVRVGRQVTLKTGTYEPIVQVKKLGCWPSEPLYDQIDDAEAAELKAKGIDLESRWADWKDREEIVLVLGRDFDVVVLGIALGGLRDVCPELVAAHPAWRAMVDGIPTVQTQAAQLWLSPTTAGLGWTGPVTVLTSYTEPMSTWADMSHLIPMESWPPVGAPRSLAYLCGTMKGPAEPPPPEDRGFPARQLEETTNATRGWLVNSTAAVWPKSVTKEGFDWTLLVAPPTSRGPARLGAQYVRCNIDPSERYVQSPPGSTKLRLEPGDCGFMNLVLAGDWVYTGINGGSVEAAAMGGMKASRALCGVPALIPGDVTKPGT